MDQFNILSLRKLYSYVSAVNIGSSVYFLDSEMIHKKSRQSN
jgi:hypothetical protein